MFPTFSEFSQVMDQICKNTGDCLVIDNTVRSYNIEDMVFWYKAPLRGNNFKTCNENAWKYNIEEENIEQGQEEIKPIGEKEYWPF